MHCTKLLALQFLFRNLLNQISFKTGPFLSLFPFKRYSTVLLLNPASCVKTFIENLLSHILENSFLKLNQLSYIQSWKLLSCFVTKSFIYWEVNSLPVVSNYFSNWKTINISFLIKNTHQTIQLFDPIFWPATKILKTELVFYQSPLPPTRYLTNSSNFCLLKKLYFL